MFIKVSSRYCLGVPNTRFQDCLLSFHSVCVCVCGGGGGGGGGGNILQLEMFHRDGSAMSCYVL